MHFHTGAPKHESEAQSQSANLTGNSGQQFDVPHLPTVLESYLSSVSAMYNLGCSQYCKFDRRALNRITKLQLNVFAEPF